MSNVSDETFMDIEHNVSNIITNVNINSYRKRLASYIELQMYDSALYWADKIVSLGEDDPNDLYWLAECLYYTKHYVRAEHVILLHGLEKIDIRSFNLLLNCQLILEKFSDFMNLVRKIEGTEKSAFKRLFNNLKSHPKELRRKLQGVRFLLAGKVNEKLGCTATAVKNYKRALKTDIHCYEALDILVQHHMLPINEEIKFVESLPYSKQCSDKEEAEIICNVYKSMLNKYHKPHDLDKVPKLPAELASSVDLTVSKAELLLYNAQYKECRKITKRVLEDDPYHSRCLEVEIVCLHYLTNTSELLVLSQRLVDTIPTSPVTWFASGCYYQLLGEGDVARRFFKKAMGLDPVYAPALLAIGNSFSLENEMIDAQTAYTFASRVLVGCYLPMLALGKDSTSLTDANNFYLEALKVAPTDPYLWNEMGILHYKNMDYRSAQRHFLCGLVKLHSVGISVMPELWETIINNLAHTNRKLNYLPYAFHFHEMSLKLSPMRTTTFASMSLLYAIAGDLYEAFHYCEKAYEKNRREKMYVKLCIQIMDDFTRSVKEEPLEVYKFRPRAGIYESPLVKLEDLVPKKETDEKEALVLTKISLKLPDNMSQLELEHDKDGYLDTILGTFITQKAFGCKLLSDNLSDADKRSLFLQLEKHKFGKQVESDFSERLRQNEPQDVVESEPVAPFSRSHSESDIENYDDEDFFALSDYTEGSQNSPSSPTPSVASSEDLASCEDSARTSPKSPLPEVPEGTSARTRGKPPLPPKEGTEEEATEETNEDAGAEGGVQSRADVAPSDPTETQENAGGTNTPVVSERVGPRRILQEQFSEETPQTPSDLATARIQSILSSFDFGLVPFMTDDNVDNASYVPQELVINEDRLSPETSLSFASCLSSQAQSFPSAEDTYYSTEINEDLGEYATSDFFSELPEDIFAADEDLLVTGTPECFPDASASRIETILNTSFGSPTPVASSDVPNWDLEAETSTQNPSTSEQIVPSSQSTTPVRPTSLYLPAELPSRSLSPGMSTRNRSPSSPTRRFSTGTLRTPPQNLEAASSSRSISPTRSLQMNTPRNRRRRTVDSLRRIALIGNMIQSANNDTEAQNSDDSDLNLEDAY